MQIESFAQYQVLAARTAKTLPQEDQRQHALMGMLTELGELTDIVKKSVIYGKPFEGPLAKNFVEEVGDFMWYCALYLTNDNETAQLPPTRLSRPEADLQDIWDSFLKPAARHLISLLAMAAIEDRTETVRKLIGIVGDACWAAGFDLRQALGLNIAKLSLRYGDKYSDEAALVRNLQAEHKLINAA